MQEKLKEFLANYRKKFDKNQKEMAKIIGVSYTTYQEMEKGIVKKTESLSKLKSTIGFNEEVIVHEKPGISDEETKRDANFIGDSYNKKMEDAVYNLTVSNSNLAIAFVKQATAHEKDADARIIQATANKILVEVNRDTLAKIPNPLTASQKYIQDSQLMTRTLDVMAKTLVRHGIYQSDEEATNYLDKLLTYEQEEDIFSNKIQKKDTQSKHKS